MRRAEGSRADVDEGGMCVCVCVCVPGPLPIVPSLSVANRLNLTDSLLASPSTAAATAVASRSVASANRASRESGDGMVRPPGRGGSWNV